ncbi:hypothetical protein P4O66_007788, partial [Electrophorus voltai]
TMGKMPSDGNSSKFIRPHPGMCVKTFSLRDKQKVFVNICQSPEVPPPPELSHEKLVELLDSDDPTGYKVPMSLGEAHTEMDNSSNRCTVYDVVINGAFFQKCEKDALFQQFIMAVCLEGLENKYRLELSRDIKILKNRKFMGSLTEQNIRTKSKPVIQEIDSKYSSACSLVLDLGEDRLLLNARPSRFHLDIYFPFFVDQENSSAQYSTKTQVIS